MLKIWISLLFCCRHVLLQRTHESQYIPEQVQYDDEVEPSYVPYNSQSVNPANSPYPQPEHFKRIELSEKNSPFGYYTSGSHSQEDPRYISTPTDYSFNSKKANQNLIHNKPNLYNHKELPYSSEKPAEKYPSTNQLERPRSAYIVYRHKELNNIPEYSRPIINKPDSSEEKQQDTQIDSTDQSSPDYVNRPRTSYLVYKHKIPETYLTKTDNKIEQEHGSPYPAYSLETPEIYLQNDHSGTVDKEAYDIKKQSKDYPEVVDRYTYNSNAPYGRKDESEEYSAVSGPYPLNSKSVYSLKDQSEEYSEDVSDRDSNPRPSSKAVRDPRLPLYFTMYEKRVVADPLDKYGKGPWRYMTYGHGITYGSKEPGKVFERGYGYVRALGRDHCKLPQHLCPPSQDKPFDYEGRKEPYFGYRPH